MKAIRMTPAEAVAAIRVVKTRREAIPVYQARMETWSSVGEDWRALNGAIIDRWSVSALIWIKAQAWKKYEGPKP